MMFLVAGWAKNPRNSELSPLATGSVEESVARLTSRQVVAAKLYGRGKTTREVVDIMLDHLAPRGARKQDRRVEARRRLLKWQRNQDFRDLVWEVAVAELDGQVPRILQGVARKARAGRVDAARLSLEVTGRHNPKGEAQPTQVAVVFSGMPRPAQAVRAMQIEPQATVEGTIEDED
jgi:hypothetical protein